MTATRWIGILLLLSSCSGKAGMYCQDSGDCASGLLCVRPRLDGGQGTFGVCEPARLGQGAVCLWSAECEPPNVCSNELGQYGGDHRHGVCVPLADGGGAVPDAGAALDASPADADSGDGGDAR